MKIAIIGAGAMGSIYGAHLSLENDVYLIDTNQMVVDHINQNGLKLLEDGEDNLYYPKAVTDSKELGEVDLVILFVKALFSEVALANNIHLIGKGTYVMTLQNGAGHEEILSKFVTEDRIIIGTTEDNGAVLAPGYIKRGGSGKTNIGMLEVSHQEVLNQLKTTFDKCGFKTVIQPNIQQLIWDKLMTNVSLSVLTGILQVKMGYIATDSYAWDIAKRLIHETVQVAQALNMDFDEEKIIKRVKDTSLGSPEGITSICADILAGRKTEVETISGAVVKAAKKCGVAVPTHELMVELVHALEGREGYRITV